MVVFAFDGFDQADLDMFADTFALPRFTPTWWAGNRRPGVVRRPWTCRPSTPSPRTRKGSGQRPSDGGGRRRDRKIAQMMEDTDRRYPGAVWTLSIGWGCDKLITAADLVPVRAALAAAQRNGTSAFDASGDLAGLECKGARMVVSPHADNIGLDAVASMPEMTNVGGTTLSTDNSGSWLDEKAWFDAPLSQGTAGGCRPSSNGRRGGPDSNSTTAPESA